MKREKEWFFGDFFSEFVWIELSWGCIGHVDFVNCDDSSVEKKNCDFVKLLEK